MRAFGLLLLVAFIGGCNGKPNIQAVDYEMVSGDTLREWKIRKQKAFLSSEREAISKYIARNEWKSQSTGTGLHYEILERKNASYNKAIPGYWVYGRVDVELMNGEKIRSQQGETFGWRFQKDDRVPLGLHELVSNMHIGDTARAIFPAHLALGMRGDLDQIPHQSALVYFVRLDSLVQP